MEALDLALQESPRSPKREIPWFSADDAVVVEDAVANVFVGGTLIGTFNEDDDDRGARNILAVTLAKSEQIHLGRLAEASGIGREYLRRLRRREETSGLAAVLGGRQGKTAPMPPWSSELSGSR